MPAKFGAGELIERVAFDKRALVDDGYGNTIAGDWEEQFQQHAEFQFLPGSETVMASRLASREPMLARIRISDQARQIGIDWQMRDMRQGKAYNIRDITYDNSRSVIDLLLEGGGVATG
jgi:head-tail adaptor